MRQAAAAIAVEPVAVRVELAEGVEHDEVWPVGHGGLRLPMSLPTGWIQHVGVRGSSVEDGW